METIDDVTNAISSISATFESLVFYLLPHRAETWMKFLELDGDNQENVNDLCNDILKEIGPYEAYLGSICPLMERVYSSARVCDGDDLFDALRDVWQFCENKRG